MRHVVHYDYAASKQGNTMPKPAVITLDFINDIANPKGKIAASAQRIADGKCVENANKISVWARKNSLPVIHVKVGFSPSYIECPIQSPMFSTAKQHQALMLGSWGAEFVEELDVQEQDHVLVKHRVSAFYNTDLETVLRAQQCDSVILTGTATNMAVESTARDAHDRDYLVIIIKDACETANQEMQDASLNVMNRFAKVITTDEWLSS